MKISFNSIKTKLGLLVSAGILITILIIVIYSSYTTRQKVILDAETYALTQAHDFAGNIKSEIEKMREQIKNIE